jgi:hypothetical protein
VALLFSIVSMLFKSIMRQATPSHARSVYLKLSNCPSIVLQSAQDACLLVKKAEYAAFIRCPVQTAGGISRGTPGAGVANPMSSHGSFYVDSQGCCHSIGRLTTARFLGVSENQRGRQRGVR